MTRKKKRHKPRVLGLHDRDLLHHIILGVILIGGFLAIVGFAHTSSMRFLIGLATTLLYVGWGIFHHYLEGDLHIKNVIEYVLLGTLGIMVLGVLFL